MMASSSSSSRKRQYSSDLIICDQCDQPLDQCIFLKNDDDAFMEEAIALSDPKLAQFFQSQQSDDSLELNITDYLLYDSNRHLISIDSGLIESDKLVYLRGYLKPLTDLDDNDDDNSQNTAIPARDIGPIEQWWISGFDGGERALIGVESALCRYNLLIPHPEYKVICENIEFKIMLTKYIIEWIESSPQSNCSQLLQNLTIKCPYLKLSRLYQVLPFILDQIQSYDEAGTALDIKLFDTPCIQQLIEAAAQRSLKLKTKSSTSLVNSNDANLSNKNMESIRNTVRRGESRKARITRDSFATCTELVATFFEQQFKGALTTAKDPKNSKSVYKELGNRGYCKAKRVSIASKIIWTSNVKHVESHSKRTYYESTKINGIELRLGDCVTLARNRKDANEDNSGIGRIIGLFETYNGQKFAHVDFLCFSECTILEETGSDESIYIIQECGDILLYKVIDKVEVEFGFDGSTEKPKNHYYCNRIYSKEFGWFKCFNQETCNLIETKSCHGCNAQEKRRKKSEIKLEDPYMDIDNKSYFKKININQKCFKENTFALIFPEFLNLPDNLCKNHVEGQSLVNEVNGNSYDEALYPERYRKQFTEFIKGSLDDVNKTYSIGRIKKIFRGLDDTEFDCQLEVQLFYRPHNCIENFDVLLEVSLDEIYLTNDERVIGCSALAEPCDVYYLEDPKFRPDYLLLPNRYFTTYSFDHLSKTYTYLSSTEVLTLTPYPSTSITPFVQPLKTLDLFSGCGGLASGFKESGASETLWAIEKEPTAAKSFSYNFPSAIVFNEDANTLLRALLDGEKFTNTNQPLPQPGEVEMILGGPPCQGFSGMNRFSNRLYSVFKNSLLVTFLSYVDYYRPKVVVFENVRNFVQFEKSKILKLTLACLLTMNYQVNYGILQAGSYGVPQSRRRTFILAMDPTLNLPNLPKPLHCFSNRACQLDIVIGNKRAKSISSVHSYGYFRSYTIADAINDLPEDAGHSLDYACSYKQSKTFYQKLMRQGTPDYERVSLHVVPTTSLLNQARIERIPCIPGADWRDLPNIRLTLSDGTVIEKLDYQYDDVKNGKSSNGALRGVCSCASEEPCSKQLSRPENTLIPWGLVHTANRNYQWSGLFGRLQWDGFFITTITKTVPSSKQGSVLHPSANRVVSIRESARSQGFPDHYHFVGSISDIKVQIGNAVPIPLARSIGSQVVKSLSDILSNCPVKTTN